MITPEEEKILEIISKRKLIRKSELLEALKRDVFIPFYVVNDLVKKGLITTVSPLGEDSFVITDKGLEIINQKD
ncbi:MAG: hypothetical protein ACE5J3_12705 [Methanosarcinales archaeon]